MGKIFNEPNLDFNNFMYDIQNNACIGDTEIIKHMICEISKYDVFDFIARVSSLNLLIENQNKSILFDTLIAGILTQSQTAYCNTPKMSAGKFKSIMNQLDNLSLHRMVDPAENAFIERVRYYGNYWIFPGINYSPSYCLQGFLDLLFQKDNQFNMEFVQKSHYIVNFVLNLSNAIVQKLGYGINTIEVVSKAKISIPDSLLAKQLQDCVYVDSKLIEDLLPDTSLRESIFTDFGSEKIEEIINSEFQDFFVHPFLKVNDHKIIILNPSILSSFAIHRLIILADSFGEKERLISTYNDIIWRKCKKDLYSLGHKKVKENAYGITLINNKNRKEEILSVGNNKLMFIHFICDSGDKYDNNSMFGQYILNDSNPTVYDRFKYFVENLPNVDSQDVYQIIVINSFGRSVLAKRTRKLPKLIFLSPFELHCVSVNERGHDEFLSRYIYAKSVLHSVLPPSVSSELNSIEVYVQNNYSFYLTDDFNPQNTSIFFSLGDSLHYVVRAIKKEDRHLIDSYDGIHLSEVVLSDPIRHIYFSEQGKSGLPELVVKYNKVNIWFSTGIIDCRDKADIYYTLIDTLSYWLAEAHSIINKMNLCVCTLCVQILLLPPFENYHKFDKIVGEFNDYVRYEYLDNTLKMIWQPPAYQLLSDDTNATEKAMIASLLNALAAFSKSTVDMTEFNMLFSNHLKKKIFAANVANMPFLAPIDANVYIISTEEDNRLLDEIGAHFLSTKEYTYGIVSEDKRIDLVNQVVGYLYSLLQAEISSIAPDGVYEKVCFDLECVIYQEILTHLRFAYDISCYPEKEDSIISHYHEINKSSVALKFLAEYIAATPPNGNHLLGTLQYDRILSICSLIIDWAYRNDLFKYNILRTPVEFLQSGRIGMSQDEVTRLDDINKSASVRQLNDISDPSISTYFPNNLVNKLPEKLEPAFLDEYGFTFQQFSNSIFAIVDYGNNMSGEVKRASRTSIVSYVSNNTGITIESVEKILDQITLHQRQDFLTPPAPYKKEDVYPWRFNRDLSFSRRPIIQYKDDLIWGNRQLNHMLKFTIDLIMEGKYKAKGLLLKQMIGELSNKRGNDFNSAVAKRLSSIEGITVYEKLSKVNGKKIADSSNNVLGDIDVLLIIPDKKKIVVGEVKDFSFAKNPYEMNKEYEKIFVDSKVPCYLTKHKRRTEWIKNHLNDVKASFALPDGKWSVIRAMFVNKPIISNMFYHKGEKIIVYSDISKDTIYSL